MTIIIPTQVLWLLGTIAAWWICGYVIMTVIIAAAPGMALGVPRHTIRAMRWGGPLLIVYAVLMAVDMREAKRIRSRTAAERKAAGLADEPRIF